MKLFARGRNRGLEIVLPRLRPGLQCKQVRAEAVQLVVHTMYASAQLCHRDDGVEQHRQQGERDENQDFHRISLGVSSPRT
jgi:hypothetical protein